VSQIPLFTNGDLKNRKIYRRTQFNGVNYVFSKSALEITALLLTFDTCPRDVITICRHTDHVNKKTSRSRLWPSNL